MNPELSGAVRPYAVVVVHFRAPHLLREVLTAVENQTVAPSQRFVVDNDASLSAEAVELLESKNWAVVRMPNLGYAPAVNAVRDLLAADIETVLVLTHDVGLAADAVAALHGPLKDPLVGMVGPILYRSSNNAVFSCGGELGPGGRTRHRLALRGAEVDWIDGAVMLLRRTALDAADWLSERYFLYFEEVDLALRMKHHSYEVHIAVNARATQEPGNFTPYLSYRNQLILAHEHNLGWKTYVVLAARVLRRGVTELRHGRRPQIGWTVRGIWDGVRGHDGPPPRTPFASSADQILTTGSAHRDPAARGREPR